MDHPNGLRALAYFDTLFPEDEVQEWSPTTSIVDQIKAFNTFGERTQVLREDDIPYFVNEFWTSGQRKAHSIHEVSYRACFKPQLPEFFIRRLTAPGDVVLDPFMGRGTTPVEAGLHHRRAFGNDINPLSVLLTRPRLRTPAYRDIQRALMEIDWAASVDTPADLLAFYHPETLRRIWVLREHLLREAPIDRDDPDPALDWIRMVAINRLTGHSSGFFSVYSLPPNQAVSVEAQRKINEKRQQVPPQRDVVSIILKKTRTLLRDGIPDQAEYSLGVGAADDLRHVPAGSVALTVTSPPFLDIVQYADDNWLRCWFAGIEASDVSISMHRTEAAWETMVRSVLTEQARVLRPGGHVAFEVGEVRNGKVLLEKLVWRAAEGLPFDRLGVMINQQEFTKTANCWGVKNNAKGTNSNQAARSVGMSRQSACKLRNRLAGTPFALAWEVALEAGLQQLAHAVMDRALNGEEVPHYHRGELGGSYRKYDNRLATWLLDNPWRVGRDQVAREYVAEGWDKLLERIEWASLDWEEGEDLPGRTPPQLDEDEAEAEALGFNEPGEDGEPDEEEYRRAAIEHDQNQLVAKRSWYAADAADHAPRRRRRPANPRKTWAGGGDTKCWRCRLCRPRREGALIQQRPGSKLPSLRIVVLRTASLPPVNGRRLGAPPPSPTGGRRMRRLGP